MVWAKTKQTILQDTEGLGAQRRCISGVHSTTYGTSGTVEPTLWWPRKPRNCQKEPAGATAKRGFARLRVCVCLVEIIMMTVLWLLRMCCLPFSTSSLPP